jgi:hypothetical protein
MRIWQFASRYVKYLAHIQILHASKLDYMYTWHAKPVYNRPAVFICAYVRHVNSIFWSFSCKNSYIPHTKKNQMTWSWFFLISWKYVWLKLCNFLVQHVSNRINTKKANISITHFPWNAGYDVRGNILNFTRHFHLTLCAYPLLRLTQLRGQRLRG